jgi:hypothetical protein
MSVRFGAGSPCPAPPNAPVAAQRAAALEALAERVRRLSPDRRDPERFHIEKDELAAELRRMARGWR